MINSFLGCCCRFICLIATLKGGKKPAIKASKHTPINHSRRLKMKEAYLLSRSDVNRRVHSSRCSENRDVRINRHVDPLVIISFARATQPICGLPLSNLLKMAIFLFGVSHTYDCPCDRGRRRRRKTSARDRLTENNTLKRWHPFFPCSLYSCRQSGVFFNLICHICTAFNTTC